METTTLILAGLGIAATAATGWWMKNRSTTVLQIADTLEDKIEDLTGIDIELDGVVEDVVEAAEDVVEDIHDTAKDSLESGDSLEDVADLTVAVLKERLTELGLSVKGKKADLVKRLKAE
jgi:hypothetical protein